MFALVLRTAKKSPILVALVLLAVLIMLYRLTTGVRRVVHLHAKSWASTFEKVVATERAHGSRRQLTSSITSHTNTIFPLSWWPEDGEFLLDLTIGGITFQVVPDTGSMFVIVSGQECAGCNKEQGVYTGKGTNTGETGTIHYGTQTDKITWFIDTFEMPGGVHLPVEFGVITSATTTAAGPPANVFGLAGSLTRKEKTPFLDQVMFEEQHLPPCFWFDFLHGPGSATLGIGKCPLPTQANSNTIQFLNQHELVAELGIDLGIDYYIAKVDAILVDGAKIPNAPGYCMFDTGNTYLTLNSKFHKELIAPIKSNSSLEFRFTGGVVLGFQLSSDPTKHMDEATFLDAKPFNGQIFIFGNAWMDGRIWMHNLENHTLTIGA